MARTTNVRVVCAGADAAALSDLAEGHLGGQGLASGPEHSAAPDRGLRHPVLHAAAHQRPHLQLWYKLTDCSGGVSEPSPGALQSSRVFCLPRQETAFTEASGHPGEGV